MLVIVSIESEDLRSGGIPRVHLGGTWMRTADTNGLGDQAHGPSCEPDGSRGLADGSGVQPDAPSVLNDAETVCVSHGEGAGTYLGTGDAKRGITEMDGTRIHADASSGCGDTLSIKMDSRIPTNTPANVSTPRKKEKPPDSPVDTTRTAPDEPNGFGDMWMGQTHAWMYTALEMVRKRLHTKRKVSVCVKTDGKHKIYRIRTKSRHSNVLVDGNESVQTVLTCTYRGTRLLRC